MSEAIWVTIKHRPSSVEGWNPGTTIAEAVRPRNRAFKLSVFVNRWLTPPAEVVSAHPGLKRGTAGLS